jgi:hypothetical protein
MSRFSGPIGFRLPFFCLVAIVAATFTVPAAGQRSANPDEEGEINTKSAVSDDEKSLRQVLEEQLNLVEEQRRVAEQQRAEATEQYRRAISELEKMRRRFPAETAEERAKMQEQLEMARAQFAELVAKQKQQQQQQAQAEPLPQDAQLRVYHLQHVKPQNLAEVLSQIFRSSAPRIAVDERANTMVVAGNEKQISIVEGLAKTLDRPAEEAVEQRVSETLQVRIVWLLDDINEGLEPTDKLVSPQVLEALGQLGFEHPRVICQQVTTLTLGEENRAGEFRFHVPVLIGSRPWQFRGQGEIEPLAGERFRLAFDLNFHQLSVQPGASQVQQGQLGGSIYTPLGHYTVMGTTTFVTDQSPPNGEDGPPQQGQHLSAFVVYLDRAQEFPASSANAEN